VTRFQVGDQVCLVAGRWEGRVGRLVRWEWVQSGQLQRYPVVRLDATSRAAARDVRVVEGSLTLQR
jgi:ribosomal protein S4E